MDKVEIIVLNFNNLDKLAFCYESIKQSTENYTLTVIDNASTDGSGEWLKYKKDIKVIQSVQNMLFTTAYMNYLSHYKVGKYFVIMNNDCVVEKNWLNVLVDFMEKNPTCGIVAPMMTDMTGKHIQNMGGGADFCSHKGGERGTYKVPEKNWWTTFACVMIRAEAFYKVGGMDRQFLFYCSDSDLCLKMILCGYTVYNHPDSVVRHYHGASIQSEISAGNRKIMEIGRQDQIKFNNKWRRNGVLIGGSHYPVEEYSYEMLRS